jgi:hypothetical protein
MIDNSNPYGRGTDVHNAWREGFEAGFQMTENLREAVRSCIRTMACDPRDWSLGKRDAWLYAILVGWGEALPDVLTDFGWSDQETKDRLLQMRTAIESLLGEGN